jgi:hypothetical protein
MIVSIKQSQLFKKMEKIKELKIIKGKKEFEIS